MPYWQGRKVTNEEWHRLRGSVAVDWKEATGWKSGDDPAPAPAEPAPSTDKTEKPKRKPRTNKAQAKSALEAITGLDIALPGEEETNE